MFLSVLSEKAGANSFLETLHATGATFVILHRPIIDFRKKMRIFEVLNLDSRKNLAFFRKSQFFSVQGGHFFFFCEIGCQSEISPGSQKKLPPKVDWGRKTASRGRLGRKTASQLRLTGPHPCSDGIQRCLQVTARVLGGWLLASACIWLWFVCSHPLGSLWFCEIRSVGVCFPSKDWPLKLAIAELGGLPLPSKG